MFTQLSLFDSAGSVDTLPSTSSFVHVSAAKRPVAKRAATKTVRYTASGPHAAAEVMAVRQTAAPQTGSWEPARCESLERPAPTRGAAYERRVDELQPMGELARLVLARYDLLASRRRERDRRRREQPRKSIRVLSPPATVS